MIAQRLRPDRIGIAVASAVGFALSCYFALEAAGAVSNLLQPRSPLLAALFSERGADPDGASNSWFRAFAFGMALTVSLATARRDPPTSAAVRVLYGLSTVVFPVIMLLVALFVQPVLREGFCVPCLLTALPALGILESRRIAAQQAADVCPDPRVARAPRRFVAPPPA